jgi:hypothetical protein
MAPHAFQVWLARTNLTAIPWCAEQSCGGWYSSHAFVNQSGDADSLISRLECHYDVLVPNYMVGGVANLTSDDVYEDSRGAVRFTRSVCICDGAMIFAGEDCMPQGVGILFAIALVIAWLWILALLFRAIYLLARGTFKRKSKQVLAVIAIAQKTSQLGWFFDVKLASIIVSEQHTRVAVAEICFAVSTLCLFAFLCGMVLESILILERQRARYHICVRYAYSSGSWPFCLCQWPV